MTDAPRNSRRRFLQAIALRDELRHRLDEVAAGIEAELPTEAAEANAAHTAQTPDGGSAPSSVAGGYLTEVSRRAMACEFGIHVLSDRVGQAAERAIETLDRLEELEQEMSIYRPDSDISQVNRLAATRSVPVPARLFGLLRRGQEIARSTAGAFDLTAGPLVKVWGFERRAGRVPAAEELMAAQALVGWESLQLDSTFHSVRFARPGMQINLGAIGKGFALDCCAAELLAEGVSDFLMHGGHSSVLARGERVPGQTELGWQVSLRHPLRPDRPAAHVWLRDQALSSSGCGTQHFYHQGERYGHILDPRTGQPAQGVLSATAITQDAAAADALSTAFYVMGEAGTAAYCADHPEAAAVLILPGAQAGQIRCAAFNLPDGQFHWADTSSS